MPRPNPGSVIISSFFHVPDVTRRHLRSNQSPSAKSAIITLRKGVPQLSTIINAVPEEDAEYELFSSGLCFLSGQFLALNEDIPSTLYYRGMESQHLIHVSFIHSRYFINSVNLESHGLFIGSIHDHDTGITTITLRHTDYNPRISQFQEFEIEYMCTSTYLSSESLRGLSLGTSVHTYGKIVGRNEEQRKWIVLVCLSVVIV
ncbi:hypothetical protein DFH28DRAFT_921489 [Melampsora americana]|nr:hypothetical protein DFH28DRAFT_921489 [Melampsora americana]